MDDDEFFTNIERLARIGHAASVVVWAYEQRLPLSSAIEALRSEMVASAEYREPTGWECPRCRDGTQLQPLSGEEFECARRNHRFLVTTENGRRQALVIGEQAQRFRGARFEMEPGTDAT